MLHSDRPLPQNHRGRSQAIPLFGLSSPTQCQSCSLIKAGTREQALRAWKWMGSAEHCFNSSRDAPSFFRFFVFCFVFSLG